jgi:hypothetical protein
LRRKGDNSINCELQLRLLNGVDGLITFISGNRWRQSLLVRFSRLSRCDPRRSTSNIYRARLSASNCNRLAFVVGEKLAIVFANVFHSPRRTAFRGESQREKREREREKKTIGRGGEGELCQTRLSIPRVVIVIVVIAVGATVQKRAPILQPPSATHPRKRSVRESRIYFTRLPARDGPRLIDLLRMKN